MSREDRRDAAILALLLLLLLLGLALLGKLELDSRAPATPARPTSTTVPTGTRTPSVHVIGGNGTPNTVPVAPASRPSGTVPVVTYVTQVPAPAAPELDWSQGLDHRCRVEDGRAICEGGVRYGQSLVPDLPVKVAQVVAGQGSTCARGEGRVFCWGFRTAGNGASSAAATEVQLKDADHIWNGPGGTVCAVSIITGGLNQKGKDDPGSLWCWGEGISADGVTGRDWSDVPVKIAEHADWDTVLVGWRTVCALVGEVELWCWGGQPDGTHKPSGAMLGADKKFDAITINRVDERRERVCGLKLIGVEVCYG